jgi:hypothetical protein
VCAHVCIAHVCMQYMLHAHLLLDLVISCAPLDSCPGVCVRVRMDVLSMDAYMYMRMCALLEISCAPLRSSLTFMYECMLLHAYIN